MKKTPCMTHHCLILATLCAASPTLGAAQNCRQVPWDSVASLLQTPAAEAAGACRYSWPRTDLTVRIGDVTIRPALALGSWAAFAAVAGDTVALGDLVVLANELGPVLRQLAEDDVTVTAIHNHLVGEEPRVTYVHFEARGGAISQARKIGRAVARTGAPRPVTAAAATSVTIDTASIYQALGVRGRAAGPVAQLSVNLVGSDVRLHGHAVPSFALASPINIQTVSDTRAVATGDFTLPAGRVDAVLDALAKGGIIATAVHSHLVGESPALYYIHFWADGPLPGVLRSLRAALDAAR